MLILETSSQLKLAYWQFSYRATFSEFAAKHAKDSRFKAIEKMKDREALFNEFVAAARKKEKEDSKTRGEKVRWFVSNGLFGGVGTNDYTISL